MMTSKQWLIVIWLALIDFTVWAWLLGPAMCFMLGLAGIVVLAGVTYLWISK